MIGALDTLGVVGIVSSAGIASMASAAKGNFSITLIFFGLALPCIAGAWDGLVRRQMLLPAFPVGAAMGQQAASIRRTGAVVVGLFCLLASIFLLLLVWGTWLVAAKYLCHSGSALTCMGTLVRATEAPAWGWSSMWVLWFVVVWLWMGDPRKRILVPGVWYHQEVVARQINRELRRQGLAPLPRERLYALENNLVRLLRVSGWLNAGAAAAQRSGGRSPQVLQVREAPSRESMLAEVQRELVSTGVGDSERVAIGLLLDYFLARAQQAEQMSPLRRWWAHRSQAAKLGVYGQRAL